MKDLLRSGFGFFAISLAIFSTGVSYGAETEVDAESDGMYTEFFAAPADHNSTLNAAAPSNSTLDGPDPSQVYIRSISYGGTGCPQGSVGQSLATDKKSFTLIFDRFIASMGPGVPVTENRKNCQLNINLHIPQGWSYTIGTFDYRGYVQLPFGQSASQKSIYYFQGSLAQATAQSNFTGPIARDYVVRDTLGMNAVVWSSCNATVPVNINAQIRIMGDGTKNGQITTDSIDGKVKHVMGIMWRKC